MGFDRVYLSLLKSTKEDLKCLLRAFYKRTITKIRNLSFITLTANFYFLYFFNLCFWHFHKLEISWKVVLKRLFRALRRISDWLVLWRSFWAQIFRPSGVRAGNPSPDKTLFTPLFSDCSLYLNLMDFSG